MQANNFCIFIPQVFEHIDGAQIGDAFAFLGKIKYVTRVPKLNAKNGKHYHAVYIHMETIYDTPYAMDFYNKLNTETQAQRIYYNGDHNYWLVLKNRGSYPPNQRKPRLVLDTPCVYNTKVESHAGHAEEGKEQGEYAEQVDGEYAEQIVMVESNYLNYLIDCMNKYNAIKNIIGIIDK